jgi:hypothetical protein
MESNAVVFAVSMHNLRPTPMPLDVSSELKALIEESWAGEPIVRPTADIFHQRIMTITTENARWTHGAAVVCTYASGG